MTGKTRTVSMKSALIWLIMLICSTTLLIALCLSIYLDYHRQQQQLHEQLSGLLDLMAINAESGLLSNNKFREEQRLKALSAISVIKNVHIYQKQNGQNNITFFASYNRADTGPWPPQIARLAQLAQPTEQNGSIEQAKAVYADNDLLGYVYIRANKAEMYYSLQKQIIFKIIIALIALAVGYLLALRLQQHFTAPLSTLLTLVHQVARDRNYSVRAPATSLTEFTLLSRAFNTMMERIERQLNRREKAEQEVKQLNLNLEQKIADRTSALKASNQELLNTLATLHQYQHQIIETEKMASLGQMVAGIAHEVNTPIGLGVTASTLLQDKVQDISAAFEQKTLTSSQLARFIDESKENLGIIYRNLERAADLVSSFKQVAVDQSNENTRQFNVLQLINEVLLSLRPNLKKTTHQIQINCPDDLSVNSKPGPISQILINLIMNSLIHAFEQLPAGQITISVVLKQHRCYLLYEDNGCGVPEQIRKRIFDPFVTTKRGEGGSGLGLHLVYNLVTQALNGNIKFESNLGHGVQIDIDFPVRNLTVNHTEIITN